ncbi:MULTISPECIES: GGDEF domain-containing protein [unclassified Luteibacter]|uniref:GGDEF domain-containing protein n=1 Tax=unclassified Luteibacter TaxID=2620188 RepID=UPI0009A61742|nr:MULTISPECIES: GGDEF domain-containing protein [unclassified Luteibacter]MDR6641812.1 diguanylate cyclase [Luteibacter sp. 1214]SKB31833.1 diguanylate cyclase [Luteibacter sp. 22Crub2.1]
MGTGVEQDIWERKYHLALERMERDERDFRDLEEGLRRLAVRLTALARGQGTDVDRLLDRLNEALRDSPNPAVLDALLDSLTEAVAGLDRLPPAVNDDAPVATLVATEALPDAPVDDDMVGSLRADIARLQDLLAAVSARLGDMTRYLAAELDHGDATDGSRQLDATVREEMKALGESTLAATDLGTLQAEVNSRLSLIDSHFREYREREDARMAAYRDRAERMRDRVAELETQTTSLQDSLRREHVLAVTDPLTGLPNRLAYERHMEGIEQDVRNTARAVCVAAFDIDHFKTINDSFGHAAGDAVLRIVGQTFTRELPEDAFVARYGGEEFVVVFGGASPEQARLKAEGLCAMVARLAFHASGKPVTVTMSGGITQFGPEDTPARAFDRADRALYAAKRLGRNRCEVA